MPAGNKRLRDFIQAGVNNAENKKIQYKSVVFVIVKKPDHQPGQHGIRSQMGHFVSMLHWTDLGGQRDMYCNGEGKKIQKKR